MLCFEQHRIVESWVYPVTKRALPFEHRLAATSNQNLTDREWPKSHSVIDRDRIFHSLVRLTRTIDKEIVSNNKWTWTFSALPVTCHMSLVSLYYCWGWEWPRTLKVRSALFAAAVSVKWRLFCCYRWKGCMMCLRRLSLIALLQAFLFEHRNCSFWYLWLDIWIFLQRTIPCTIPAWRFCTLEQQPPLSTW